MGRRFLAAFLAVVCGASLAGAQSLKLEPVRLEDADVLRTLREVYLDLGDDGKATQYRGVRILPDSVDEEADKPRTVDVDLSGALQGSVTLDRSRYLLAMAQNLLFAARIAPGYRFFDAAAVQTDPGGPPGVMAAFAIAPDVPGIVVVNAHHNSQEGFVDYRLLGVVGGRLAVLYRGPFLYSVALIAPACGEKVVTQRLEAFEPLATRHDGFANLSPRVVEQGECRSGDQTTKLPAKRVSAVLIWNARTQAYEGGEKELASLGKAPQ